MEISNMAKSITAVFALISITFAGFFFIENRYTHQPEFLSLQKRVSINELQRQLRQAEEEAAYYRRLLRDYPNDERIKEKLRQAEKRVERLEREIERLG